MQEYVKVPTLPLLETHVLEESGLDGYEMYRIPVLVTTGGGVILAVYLASNSDRQTIFIRRSLDSGLSWSCRHSLVRGENGESIHNPVLIAEAQGHVVHFLWHKNHDRCFYQRSDDDGLTWSGSMEITYAMEKIKKEFPWKVFSAGPGHGIQTQNGRLITPVWMASGVNHRPSVVTTLYSDDGGATWSAGEIISKEKNFINPNETTLTELENGSILATMRHESLTHCRAFSISPDGTSGWSAPYFNESLSDPICHASLVNYNDGESKGILLSNCDWKDEACLEAKRKGKALNWSDDARRKLTVSFSSDGGKTWDVRRLLQEKSGYSDLTVCGDKETILCLYEKDWMNNNCIFTKEIAVARFTMEWLRGE